MISLTAAAAPAADLDKLEVMIVPDIALSAGIQDRMTRMRGAAPADFDLDGDMDIFLSSTGDSSRFFWNTGVDNNGDVVFQKGEVLVSGVPAYFTSAADYDNDGDPDLFIGVGGVDDIGYDYLFENIEGDFVDVTRFAGVAGPVHTSGDTIMTATGGGAWGDYDRDGFLDLYVTTHVLQNSPPQLRGRNTLYRNLGDGTFEDVTNITGVGDRGSGWAPSWLDFDNDGFLDLYVANRAGPNVLYRNLGDGSFADVTTLELSAPMNSWGSLTDDFNNDLWMDLFVVGRSTNPNNQVPHGFFINDGTGSFTNETFSSGLNIEGDPTTFSDWMGFQAGDLTNDAYPEIYLGGGNPGSGSEDHLFLNRYSGSELAFQIISPLINYPAPEDGFPNFPEYPYRTHGIAFVDFDEDGDLDLFVGNGGPGSKPETREPNRLFRNDVGNRNNWIRLHLVGTLSNRDGIGSRIVVRSRLGAGEINIRHKMVKGISGFGGNNPIDQHIGIANDDQILKIFIWWPSGIIQAVSDPPINQEMTIVEPSSGRSGTVLEFLSIVSEGGDFQTGR